MLIEEEVNNKEEKKETVDSEIDTAIDTCMAVLPLDEAENKIVNNIINAPTQKDLQEQFDLFNINQAKKNALRIVKLNNLLDKVEDQAIERFEKRPDQVSNKEILEYMQVVSSQIERSQETINVLKEKPMIKAVQNKTEVNVNIGTELDKDSKERVIDAIQALLAQVKNPIVKEDEVIEADVVNLENIENEKENIVYKNDDAESGEGE